MEKTGCKLICGAPTTLAVKEFDDDDDEIRLDQIVSSHTYVGSDSDAFSKVAKIHHSSAYCADRAGVTC